MVASGGDDFTIRLWRLREPAVAGESHRGAKSRAGGSERQTPEQLAHSSSTSGPPTSSSAERAAHLGRYKPLHTLRHHSSRVVGLQFSPEHGSGLLLSAGEDRKVLHLQARERVLMETLFGHAAAPGRVDVVSDARAASAGGRERTVRLWKLKEQSQLVFRAPGGCEAVDVVAIVHPGGGLVLSGSHDGRLLLWS